MLNDFEIAGLYGPRRGGNVRRGEMAGRLARALRDLAAWPYAADALMWLAYLTVAAVIVAAGFS